MKIDKKAVLDRIISAILIFYTDKFGIRAMMGLVLDSIDKSKREV